MAAKRDHLRDLTFQIDRAFRKDRAAHRAGGQRGQFHFSKLIIVTAAFYTAPVHCAHQFSGGQVDNKFTAVLNQLVTVPLRAHADAHHRGLGANGTGPANGNQIGGLHAAAAYQNRRLRIQEGTAFPGLLCHKRNSFRACGRL